MALSREAEIFTTKRFLLTYLMPAQKQLTTEKSAGEDHDVSQGNSLKTEALD